MSATTANHTNLRFSSLLRRVFPKHAAKLTARAAGRTVRAAETWLADKASPSWDTVYAMARRNDDLRQALIQALQEPIENAPTKGRAVSDAGECSDPFAPDPFGELGPSRG